MSNGSAHGIYDDVQNEWWTRFYENAGVDLNYNGTVKLATTSTGVTITGTATATTFSGTLSGNATSATTAGSCTGNSATATLASTVTVNSSSSAAWYDALWASGNTVYGQSNVEIYPAGGYLRAVYLNMSHASTTRSSDSVFFSSADDYIRKNNATGFRASLNVPTRTGGDASGTWGINITGSSASATTAGSCTGNAASATEVRVVADAAGNRALVLTVADGNTDTTATLYKDSGTSAYFNTSNNTLVVPTLSATSSITSAGNITAYSSDSRLKLNQTPIDGALNKVMSIGGYTFDWDMDKCDSLDFKPANVHEHGVIAQEIETVVPDAVCDAPFDRDIDGNSISGDEYKTVRYERLVPLLIEAIKEQQAQIDELKEIISGATS
jgi:hypothetical protein